jgi:hypothetical protein
MKEFSVRCEQADAELMPARLAARLCGGETRRVAKQERQCTLKRVHETIVAWKSNKYFTFVCVWGGGEEWVVVSERVLACACARVALLIQHKMRRHIVTCGLSGSTKFFDIVS